jgi:hypothetical protein
MIGVKGHVAVLHETVRFLTSTHPPRLRDVGTDPRAAATTWERILDGIGRSSTRLMQYSGKMLGELHDVGRA